MLTRDRGAKAAGPHNGPRYRGVRGARTGQRSQGLGVVEDKGEAGVDTALSREGARDVRREDPERSRGDHRHVQQQQWDGTPLAEVAACPGVGAGRVRGLGGSRWGCGKPKSSKTDQNLSLHLVTGRTAGPWRDALRAVAHGGGT